MRIRSRTTGTWTRCWSGSATPAASCWERPRTARLTKALVYDQQSAANVGTSQDSNEDAGMWNVVVTPRPGHGLTELEASVDAILDKL